MTSHRVADGWRLVKHLGGHPFAIDARRRRLAPTEADERKMDARDDHDEPREDGEPAPARDGGPGEK